MATNKHRNPAYLNYPPLYCNILDGLAGASDDEKLVEEAQTIFLRWKDRDWRNAEKAAYNWIQIGGFLSYVLPHAIKQHKPQTFTLQPVQIENELRTFMKERLEYYIFPQKKKIGAENA